MQDKMRTILMASLLLAGASAEAAFLNGIKYEVIVGRTTWEAAEADAEAKGGHLVTINSQLEWNAVKALVNDFSSDIPSAARSFPIGLIRDRATRTHTWLGGAPAVFTDWSNFSPDYDLDFGDWVYAA